MSPNDCRLEAEWIVHDTGEAPWRLFPPDLTHSTDRKLKEFAGLEEGWHFGEGVPPKHSVIGEARRLYDHACGLGLAHSDAFPGLDGEVRLTFYFDEKYLEFTLESDGRVVFLREDGDVETEGPRDMTLSEATEYLSNFWKVQWRSFESLAQGGTMTSEEDGFRALRSRTPQEEAFRSSNEPASLRAAVPYAPTCATSTPV